MTNHPYGLRIKIASVLSSVLAVYISSNAPDTNYVYVAKEYSLSDGSGFALITNNLPVLPSGTGSHLPQTIYKSWKRGSYRQFGLVYYDRANRSGAANVDDNTVVYVKSVFEDPQTAGLVKHTAFRTFVDWEINHKPPIWATHYQWVVSKNTTLLEYLQYNIKGMSIDSNGNTRVGFNDSLVDYNTASPKSILGTWTWAKGDRLRFLLYGTGVNGQWEYMNNINTYANYYNPIDFEIIGYDSTSQEFICEPFDTTYFLSTIGVPINEVVIEVYRPAKEFHEQIMYEFGENFEIGDAGLPTRYHKGATQDQTATLPATGTFFSGDCYLKLRWASQGDSNFIYFPCESEHLSDFYISDSYDIGRINVVDRNMKQRRLKSNMRFSQKLIQDTQINGLSTFLVLDAEQMPDKFGAIERLIEVADVIKIVQNAKCSSVYVGRQSTAEADTTTNIYITSKVLGTIVIPAESYGTMHPESVCRWNRQLYFFDLLNGVYVRNSANGTFEISSYGQVDYFRKWQTDILNANKFGGKTKVLSAYDKRTEQLIVTLSWELPSQQRGTNGSQQPITNRKETIAFLENVDEAETSYSNQWKTFYNFTPEYYGYNGTAFVSFLNGHLWLHNDNATRCSYYGVKYPEKITFICNIEPETIKRFMAMAYNSNKRWQIERVYIPPSENYPQGMLSEIKDGKFVSKEGFYYSEFNKDINTPGFANTLEALINGRDLRGQTVEITMSNVHDDEVVLFSSYIDLLPSPKSGV